MRTTPVAYCLCSLPSLDVGGMHVLQQGCFIRRCLPYKPGRRGLTAAPVVLVTVLDTDEVAASDWTGVWTLGDACTLTDAELGLSGLADGELLIGLSARGL